MTAKTNRGEVWLIDLGMTAKVRPGLVLSIPAHDENDRVLTTIVPHTTSVRNSRFEVRLNIPFLKPGAFDAQNIITIPSVKLIRRLGTIRNEQMIDIERTVKVWLGFQSNPSEVQ